MSLMRSWAAIAVVAMFAGLWPALLAAQDPPPAPWRALFNGRDLEGWTPKIRGFPVGDDPLRTFHVEEGLLTVGYDQYDAFDERFGHLFYETPFSSYDLRVEYRFIGSQASGGPGWATRNSGVMIHSQSPESMGLQQDFPISIEVQLLGGDGEAARPTANLCTPGTHVHMNGQLAEQHCFESSSATYHGSQWVEVDIIVRGGRAVAHVIEGDTVMAYSAPEIGGGVVSGFDPAAKDDGRALTSGWIALQSESHPVQFRGVWIREIGGRDPRARSALTPPPGSPTFSTGPIARARPRAPIPTANSEEPLVSDLTGTPTADLLGVEAEYLLGHTSTAISKELLHLPGPDFVDRVWSGSDRSPRVLGAMEQLFRNGRLGGTGYVSILPVDQGIEHSGGASFAPNPIYFDPENIVNLAIEGGCNAVASTYGVLGAVARRYAHKIPMILKFNHSELLTYPNHADQIPFAQVQNAWDMGCVGVGATIYFGSEESGRQIQEVSEAFSMAHELGMVTILWCYVRNSAFKVDGVNHEASADLTGQANHLGVTIEADIIKQKQPTSNGGYPALNKDGSFGKFDERMYTELATDHPIDLTRYQLANCYMGRAGLINSGGASGSDDLVQAVRTAVINKRAGGMGLISGRKAFQRPMGEGVEILNAIQDVYLDPSIDIA